MKKLMNKANFAIIGLMISMSSVVAATSTTPKAPALAVNYSGLCDLIERLGTLLKTVRILAFIGAGFLIAQWAWEFVSKPQDVKLETFKTKGVGMLVGFVLLFSVGAVLTFFINAAGAGGSLGCAAEKFRAW